MPATRRSKRNAPTEDEEAEKPAIKREKLEDDNPPPPNDTTELADDTEPSTMVEPEVTQDETADETSEGGNPEEAAVAEQPEAESDGNGEQQQQAIGQYDDCEEDSNKNDQEDPVNKEKADPPTEPTQDAATDSKEAAVDNDDSNLVVIDRTGDDLVEAAAADDGYSVLSESDPPAANNAVDDDPPSNPVAETATASDTSTLGTNGASDPSAMGPAPVAPPAVTQAPDPALAPAAMAQPSSAPTQPVYATPQTTTTTTATNQPAQYPAAGNAEAMIEEQAEIPASVVGKVIGKGGEQIRDLQARSGARIDVDQTVPPGHARLITYKGTRSTVDYAKMLVSMLSQEGVTENDLPLGLAKRESFTVPSQSVGKIIGQRGMCIRDLQVKSEAKIQIDHSGASGIPADKKQITIIGTEPAVVKAKELIMFIVVNPLIDALQSISMMIDEKLSGRSAWGSGPPYPSMPNQGYNMTVEMIDPQAASGGSYGGGYGGGYQQPTAGFYGQGHPATYPPHQAPYQAAQPVVAPQAHMGFAAPGGVGQVEVDVIYEPKPYMGRVIGQRGVTVNDLQRRSGCDIQINQQNVAGPNCEITIRGPRDGIESAKRMIREIIEVGPAHPYAGGAEAGFGQGSGGGGGGGGGGYYQQQQGGYSQHYGGQPGFGAAQGYGQQVSAQPQYGQQQGGYGHQGGYGQPHAASYGQAQPPSQAQFYGGAPAAYQAPPVAPAPVPAWKSATSPDGQVYYYNEQTGATQWDKPPGFA